MTVELLLAPRGCKVVIGLAIEATVAGLLTRDLGKCAKNRSTSLAPGKAPELRKRPLQWPLNRP